MGYWATSLTGASLQLFGDPNPDGSEMLWGDAPADCLDGGIERLIDRLHTDLGRWPTVAEVDAVKADSPEMVAAIAKAKQVFEADIERPATDGEIAAGLDFTDTGISLDSAMRRDIGVGDTITWAVMRDCGFYQEVDYIHAGVVAGEDSCEAEGYGGRTYTKRYYNVVDNKGIVWAVEKAYANKVLPGDKTVDEINAEREKANR